MLSHDPGHFTIEAKSQFSFKSQGHTWAASTLDTRDLCSKSTFWRTIFVQVGRGSRGLISLSSIDEPPSIPNPRNSSRAGLTLLGHGTGTSVEYISPAFILLVEIPPRLEAHQNIGDTHVHVPIQTAVLPPCTITVVNLQVLARSIPLTLGVPLGFTPIIHSIESRANWGPESHIAILLNAHFDDLQNH
ncbi:hypothetical protein ABKN59_000091 [Abortiporus biennis]